MISVPWITKRVSAELGCTWGATAQQRLMLKMARGMAEVLKMAPAPTPLLRWMVPTPETVVVWPVCRSSREPGHNLGREHELLPP